MRNQSLIRPDPFGQLTAMTLATVADSSARVYQDTYNSWLRWAIVHDVDPLAINGQTVRAFLSDQHVAVTTRQRMLSAMRTAAQVLATVDYTNPARRAAYETMKMVKAPKTNANSNERKRRALTPDQVERLYDVWLEDSLLHVRNQALITVMFSSGARRAEITALQWGDVNLDEGVIHIRHGKGDAERYAALFGDLVIRSFDHWKHRSGERSFVFCPLDKYGNLGADRSMSADNLYRIVTQTGLAAGVEWKPHDARRTLATELLNMGMSTAEVQAQLGHADAATTLRYAQSGSAAQRRKSTTLRYGD